MYNISSKDEALRLLDQANASLYNAPEKANQIVTEVFRYANYTKDIELLEITIPYYAMNNIVLRLSSEEYENCIEIASQLLKHTSSPKSACRLYSTLALLAIVKNNYSEGRAYLDKAFETMANSAAKEVGILMNSGILYYKLEQYDKMWDSIIEAERLVFNRLNELSNKNALDEKNKQYCSSSLGLVYYNSATLFIDLEDYETSIYFLEQCLVFSQQFQVIKTAAHYLLIRNYCLINSREKAGEILSIMSQYKDSFTSFTETMCYLSAKCEYLLFEKKYPAAWRISEELSNQSQEIYDYDSLKHILFLCIDCFFKCYIENGTHFEQYSQLSNITLFISDKITKLELLCNKWCNHTEKLQLIFFKSQYHKMLGENEISMQLMEEYIILSKNNPVNVLQSRLYLQKALSNISPALTSVDNDLGNSSRFKRVSFDPIFEHTEAMKVKILQKLDVIVRSESYTLSNQLIENQIQNEEENLFKHTRREYVNNIFNTQNISKGTEEKLAVEHRDFLKKISLHCPALTSTELRVCLLLKFNLTSHQIAKIMAISPLTVFKHRRNIRKKLNIKTFEDLTVYLINC